MGPEQLGQSKCNGRRLRPEAWMNLTQMLAFVGAVTGPLGLGLGIYVALRDTARIVVFAGPDDPARRDLRPPSDSEPRSIIHVRNLGRRPVAIERVWYTKRSTGSTKHLLTDRFDAGTQYVREGESLTYERRRRNAPPEDLRSIVVEAQDGSTWRGGYDAHALPMRWND